MIEVSALKDAIAKGDASTIAAMIKRFDLTIVDGKITASKSDLREMSAYWDKRQLVTKISLNSLYGALLNSGCRFEDKRIGQSTTLTGRSIAKHMHSYVNESITGKYDHEGAAIIYGDTDSEVCTTKHQTNFGEKEIQELFASCTTFWNTGEKEYASNPDLMVLSYDDKLCVPYFGHINYIYRHKVSKDLYEITDTIGNSIVVTSDHSVMVLRNGDLVEVAPANITPADMLISVRITKSAAPAANIKETLRAVLSSPTEDSISVLQASLDAAQGIARSHISLIQAPVAKVQLLRTAVDEYVYDIGMKNESKPWYFGNNILIHNSSYFSVWPIIKDDVAAGHIPWSKEICIDLYDGIADGLNDSFPEFMYTAFHCPRENGALIKGGRELIAEKGLFITKKRYAVLIFDLEGKRCDVLGEPGKLKAMGLDLKRSDTPTVVQKFLSNILLDTLTGVDKSEIIAKVKAFKLDFASKPSWEKGVPKRVNNLSKFTAMVNSGTKGTVPGHVRASINWNNLKRLNGDQHSIGIVDGMKTIVCRLKDNPMGYHSVAIPIDQKQLPEWYKSLPFDDDEMEKIIVDQKVDNLLGVLEWDLENLTDTKTTFQSLFSFD